MHENKTFYFIFYLFFYFVLTKTRYFNTGFVSLQYKNTNQYCAKLIKKIYGKITNFFEKIFEIFLFNFFDFFLGLGLARPIWLGSSRSLVQTSDLARELKARVHEQCEGN